MSRLIRIEQVESYVDEVNLDVERLQEHVGYLQREMLTLEDAVEAQRRRHDDVLKRLDRLEGKR